MNTVLKRLILSSFVLLFAASLHFNNVKAQGQTPPDAEGETVVDKLNSHDDTSTFAQLLQESGFGDILTKKGPFTVLAPSDDALQSGDTNPEQLRQNPQQLKKFVRGHLYQGEVPSDQIESGMGVEVQDTDNSASNGTIYVVDQAVQR